MTRLPSSYLQTTGLALLFSGSLAAQQNTNSSPQMPQAPRAPQAQTATVSTAPPNAGGTVQPPDISARIDLNLQNSDGQDDTDELRRDSAVAEAELKLLLEQSLGQSSRLVAQMAFASERYSEDALNNDDEQFTYDVERLFFQTRPRESLRLRAGRQAIDDPLQALVDEDLDGLRISYEAGIAEFEISLTREDWFEASTFAREDNITNTMGLIEFSPNKDTLWMPYVLHRSAEPLRGEDAGNTNWLNNDQPVDATWAGLQGIVEPESSAFRYWIHGSVLNGEANTDSETTELGGYSVNLGLNWKTNLPMQPTITVAAAHATGGNRSERFRQSRLHSNDFALNGKNTFRYLGEVVDPELTNIRVLTFGIGANLTKDWRYDVALHSYQQVELEDNLRGSDLEYSPLGIDDDLGQAADFILAYRPNRQLQVQGTLGSFMPGKAFEDSRDTAWVVKMELEYRFW